MCNATNGIGGAAPNITFTISVKINGAYHDFGAFAADIARLPRIVTLNNIAITPTSAAGGLSLDATTKTFRYLDDEEIARQKKPAQGATR